MRLAALLLCGCTFTAPEVDASMLGVCLWTRSEQKSLGESPRGCWKLRALDGGKLTAFELADPCDAPEMGVDSLVVESGAEIFAYYYGATFEKHRFSFVPVGCP